MISVGWRRKRNGFLVLLKNRKDFGRVIADEDVIDNIIIELKEDIMNWRWINGNNLFITGISRAADY